MTAAAPRRLRVVLVSFDFGNYCVPLANGLAEHADLTLVLPDRELFGRETLLDGRVALHTYTKPRLRQPLRQLRWCGRLVRLIRAAAPDVVHVQQGHFFFNLALPLLRGVPLVVTVHDAQPHLGDAGARKTPLPLMRVAFRRADRLIVHGERMRELLVSDLGLSAETVDVIAHPAALLPPDAAAASEQAVTDDSCTVLFFGRIWPYKGLDVLIRAEPRISERIPGLRIVIAGEGEPFERYEKLMIDPARFTVINRFVSEAEVGTLFRKATVVVLPYLEASQSGVIPVAYFHGKPVVVTDVGGLPEAVHDGETGFVVPAGDEVRLADAVVRILSDDDLRLRMGANARMLADAWSPEHVAERTTRVYEKVVGRVSADPTVTDTVLRLHRYLKSSHWRDDALIGPDCGVRFNYRAGRFVKSALPSLPWHDDRYYLQAQGYWIIANWRLADALGQDFADIAVRCSDEVVRRQTPDGAWEYPNPAWKGRIATAEGTWAALGLLETYSHTRDDAYLESALRWHHYLDNEIAWLPVGGGIAVNYFANRAAPAVPNNTAFVLRFLGELAHATDDERWLSRTDGLATFLAEAQRPTGEMPYELNAEATRLEHFQCFQYNAFQLLDLIRYEECTNDRSLRPTSEGMARFLANAVGADGTHPHDCRHRKPTVTYHSAAIAAALAAADDAGLHAGGRAVARQIWSTVSKAQRADGSFPHSRGDHVVLRDRRSYPRNLAMILTHGLSMDGPASDHIHSSRSVQ